MLTEILPASISGPLMGLLQKHYSPYYYNAQGDTRSEMLCDLTTSFLRYYILGEKPLADKIPLRVPKQILKELKQIERLLGDYTHIDSRLLRAFIFDLMVQPQVVGLIVVIREEL